MVPVFFRFDALQSEDEALCSFVVCGSPLLFWTHKTQGTTTGMHTVCWCVAGLCKETLLEQSSTTASRCPRVVTGSRLSRSFSCWRQELCLSSIILSGSALKSLSDPDMQQPIIAASDIELGTPFAHFQDDYSLLQSGLHLPADMTVADFARTDSQALCQSRMFVNRLNRPKFSLSKPCHVHD